MIRIPIETIPIRRIENRSLILLKLFRGEDAMLIRHYMPEITRRREVTQSGDAAPFRSFFDCSNFLHCS